MGLFLGMTFLYIFWFVCQILNCIKIQIIIENLEMCLYLICYKFSVQTPHQPYHIEWIRGKSFVVKIQILPTAACSVVFISNILALINLSLFTLKFSIGCVRTYGMATDWLMTTLRWYACCICSMSNTFVLPQKRCMWAFIYTHEKNNVEFVFFSYEFAFFHNENTFY